MFFFLHVTKISISRQECNLQIPCRHATVGQYFYFQILVNNLLTLISAKLNNTSPISVFNFQLSVEAGVLAVASGDVYVEVWRPRK